MGAEVTRDDFVVGVKRILAARVNMRCSKPDCRAPTSGPESTENGTINLGVAAHITAAAPGGLRYDAELSSYERGAISNGIWLCQNCAKLVDSDIERFPPQLLRKWKADAELKAYEQLGKPANSVLAQTLLPWPLRAGGPQFRMHPGRDNDRLLCEFEITNADPYPGAIEARWLGGGVVMDWTQPMRENRPGKYQMKPVPMAPTSPNEEISFEVRFNLNDGLHWGRWTWRLRRHEKGTWNIESEAGNVFQPQEYDGKQDT